LEKVPPLPVLDDPLPEVLDAPELKLKSELSKSETRVEAMRQRIEAMDSPKIHLSHQIQTNQFLTQRSTPKFPGENSRSSLMPNSMREKKSERRCLF
jgi:hypothetical protein